MRKIIIFIFISTFLSANLLGQSKEVLAKSYFLKAQEAFGNNQNILAIEHLDNCVKNLEATNSKIEAFYVRLKTNYTSRLQRKKHLEYYFENASEDHSDYIEMVELSTKVSEAAIKYKEEVKSALEIAKSGNRDWEKDGPLYIKYCGFFNAQGELSFPFKYLRARPFQDNVAVVMQYGNLYGLINREGRELIKCRKGSITDFKNGTAITYSGNRSRNNICLIDTLDNHLSAWYNTIQDFQDNKTAIVTRVDYNDKRNYGIINDRGGVIVKPIYETVLPFSEGLAYIEEHSKTYENIKGHYVDKRGNRVINLSKGSQGESFSNELAKIKKRIGSGNYKYGYINKRGSYVISPQYKKANKFSEGLAFVQKNEKVFAINKKNTKQFDINAQFLSGDKNYFFGGLGIVRVGNNVKTGRKTRTQYKSMLIDNKGKVIITKSNDRVLKFSNVKGILIGEEKDGTDYLLNNKGLKISSGYSLIKEFSEGLAIVFDNSKYKYGYVDVNGNEVIPLKYKNAQPFKNGLAVVDGAVLKPLFKKYNRENAYSEGLAVVKQAGKYGFADEDNSVKIALNYQDAWSFKNNIALVKKENKYGVINKEGAIVIDIKYDSIFDFNQYGIAKIILNKKYGLISNEGVEVQKPINEAIFDLQTNGALKFVQNKKYGLFNQEGEVIIKPKYDKLYNFEKVGLAGFELNNKEGLIDKNGKEVVTNKYDKIYTFQEIGLAKFSIGNKYGIINSIGEEIVTAKYHKIYNTQKNGMTIFVLGSKFGMINKDGKEIITAKYDNIYATQDNGLITYVFNGKSGLTNIYGKEITTAKFDKIYRFQNNNLTVVVINGKHGIIDQHGNEILKAEYDDLFAYQINGLAEIKNNNKYGFVNQKGEIVVPIKYQSVYTFDSGICKVKNGKGQTGYVNENGKEIVKPGAYDYVYSSRNGTVRVRKKKKKYIISKSGKRRKI